MAHDDASPRQPDAIAALPVIAAVGGFFLFTLLSIAVLVVFYRALVRSPVYVPPRPFPGPGLQVDDAADLTRIQQTQRARLQGYGWVDRDRNEIRIPIEDAMALVAARGSAGYDPLPAPPDAPRAKGAGLP